MSFSLEPIAYVRSCFGEKFATPRQPGLVPAARATIFLDSQYRDAVKGLEQFSHIWLCFWFHQTAAQGWSPTVRPPRLGGNQRIGVFATRSNFRPNPIGWSAVELLDVQSQHKGVMLTVAGADLVDGTPLLDIKPYLPYADVISDARAEFAANAPQDNLEVVFSASVIAPERTLELVKQAVAQDPRPAYKQGELSGEYGAKLDGYDVRWQVKGRQALIIQIKKLD